MVRKSKKSGYTLIEVMLASVIFVMVVSIAVGAYASSAGFQSKASILRETNQGARYVIEMMTKDIRSADSGVVDDSAVDAVVFDGFAFIDSGVS